eukprot:4642056-Karenia_brevis.AAC.1
MAQLIDLVRDKRILEFLLLEDFLNLSAPRISTAAHVVLILEDKDCLQEQRSWKMDFQMH